MHQTRRHSKAWIRVNISWPRLLEMSGRVGAPEGDVALHREIPVDGQRPVQLDMAVAGHLAASLNVQLPGAGRILSWILSNMMEWPE